MTKILLALICLVFVFLSRGAEAQTPPPGFTDPNLLAQVMGGTIVATKTIDTDSEEEVFLRSFFKNVTPAQYAAITTNYEAYPSMFSEIKSATTTSVNADRTIFEYSMQIVFYAAFFPITTHPQGRHTLALASGPAESTIHNELLNYQDTFESAQENIRLIPYQNGMLVEDDVHAIMKDGGETSQTIKTDLVAEFSKFMKTFREKLNGSLGVNNVVVN